MPNINPTLKLTPDTYNDTGFASITNLARASQMEADWLDPWVTHISYAMGSKYSSVNFPMLAMTEGAGNTKKVNGFEYNYPILGRMKKTSTIAKTIYAATDKPGVGHSLFKVYFTDRWFSNSQTLYTPNKYSVRVQGDPIKVGDMYEYTMQLWSPLATAYIPVSELTAGVVWSGGVHKAPFEDSSGVESRAYLGGTATNMTSLVRHSYKLKGNVQNKVMKYEIKTDTGTFKTFVDWELFLADMSFREACEADLWYSEYGKDSAGELYMVDDNTSVPVTSGAGIDQQITNVDTYSFLTYKKMSQVIRDVFFNVADKPEVTMWTGTGGMEEFDNALKNELRGFTQLIDSRQFVKGENSYDLQFGAYFKVFQHQDGGTVKVMKHPMFDRGLRADVAPIHPVSGLPLTSHDFYFIDNSTYEGVPNVQYVQEIGREYQKWAVSGSIVPIGFSKSDLRASDKDAASVHGMKSQGIQIMNTAGCFKLLCTLS